MQESGVYRITNIKTGRAYVGSAINLTKRLVQHFVDLKRGVHHCKYLQRSYDKWGKDAFDTDVIEYVDDIERLLEREQFYLDSLGMDALYNTTPTAGSRLGSKTSDETKAKQSIAAKKRKASEETKAKMRGRRASEETRAKMSAALMGRRDSDETRKKKSIAKSNRIVTDATRKKLSDRIMTEEWRRKISIARTGTKASDEARANMSIARKICGVNSVSLANLHNGPVSNRKAVQQLNTQTGEVIRTFLSIREAERQTGILRQNIIDICQGKRGHKTAGGYGWKYIS